MAINIAYEFMKSKVFSKWSKCCHNNQKIVSAENKGLFSRMIQIAQAYLGSQKWMKLTMFSRNIQKMSFQWWHQNCKSEKIHLQFRCKVSNLLNNLPCFDVWDFFSRYSLLKFSKKNQFLPFFLFLSFAQNLRNVSYKVFSTSVGGKWSFGLNFCSERLP